MDVHKTFHLYKHDYCEIQSSSLAFALEVNAYKTKDLWIHVPIELNNQSPGIKKKKVEPQNLQEVHTNQLRFYPFLINLSKL